MVALVQIQNTNHLRSEVTLGNQPFDLKSVIHRVKTFHLFSVAQHAFVYVILLCLHLRVCQICH